jgi:catalase
MTVTPEQATAAANEVFGRHPGHRALHAKGVLLKGSFVATPEAAALTRAAHMQGERVPATVRVSNGAAPRMSPTTSRMCAGSRSSCTYPTALAPTSSQTAPRFPVHTPDEFVELLRAQRPVWRLPLYLARHPEVLPRLPANLPALRPPASYATCTYYAIHAFAFLDANGGSRFVRYTLLPEAGDVRIGPREARRRGRDYLQQEIRARVAQQPVRFTLELQLAAHGDDVDDPASAWPKERRRVRAGTLEITGLETERETDGDVLVFDPTRVVDGIELSNDPVLRFRAAAYSDSVAHRIPS